MPVSMALAGPVGEWIGIPLTFVLAGLVPDVPRRGRDLGWRLPADEIAHPLDPAATPTSRHRSPNATEPGP